MALELQLEMLECSFCDIVFTAEYLLVDSPSVEGFYACWVGSNVIDPVHILDLSFGLDLSSDFDTSNICSSSSDPSAIRKFHSNSFKRFLLL